MTILSAQSVRRANIFTPFVERSVHELTGCSYGLSSAGYDVRLAESTLLEPGDFFLASTVEHFRIPDNILGRVHDKSTFARRGLAVQNTVAEPGWYGNLTLELTNHGREPIRLYSGQPIAQIVFEWLDEPTEQPYVGKYQGQEARPVGPRREEAAQELRRAVSDRRAILLGGRPPWWRFWP